MCVMCAIVGPLLRLHRGWDHCCVITVMCVMCAIVGPLLRLHRGWDHCCVITVMFVMCAIVLCDKARSSGMHRAVMH